MNNWQKKHVRKNLTDLIAMTDCNMTLKAALLADELLSNADVEKLTALREKDGKSDESAQLYIMIESRSEGYEKLMKALGEVSQSGAAEILHDGVHKHRKNESKKAKKKSESSDNEKETSDDEGDDDEDESSSEKEGSSKDSSSSTEEEESDKEGDKELISSIGEEGKSYN